MIALDTNVLVRLLVEDDREQARRAVALLRGAAGRGEQAFVTDVVVREQAQAAGCEAVATFDRALHRVPGFVAA